MNVFIIPSWYPTDESPVVGIFIKEQALSMSNQFHTINIGISLWGSNRHDLLIQKKDHIKNLFKVLNFPGQSESELSENCIEYFTPAFTWTRSILNGNIEKIIESNISNLKRFEARFGAVNLIHAHVGHPAGYIAAELSRKYNIPYIITEHMSPFPMADYKLDNGNLHSLLKRAYSRSKANIGVSHFQLKQMGRFALGNLELIPNMVNGHLFTVKEKKKANPFNFLSIGRLEDQKGFDLLLKSLNHLKEIGYSDVKLRIGGSGKLTNRLLKLCNKLHLDNDVTWLGELGRNDVIKEMQGSNAFVLASRHESFGLVLAEALACGKPIISTDCGGPVDIVSNKNGLLAKLNDFKDLSIQMANLIENYSSYNPMVIRDEFEQKFSSEIVGKKLFDLYQKTIQS